MKRSSTSSIPMERRTKSSGSVRRSAGMDAWLITQGISQRLLTLPKETVVLKRRQASAKRREISTEPVVKLSTAPELRLWERWIAKLLASQPPFPGKYTRVTSGWPTRNAATLCAFCCARSNLKLIVLMPRRNRKHSKGASAVPSAFCKNAMRCASSASRTHTNPPVQSAWPEKNFVAECTTTSTPNVNGLHMTGGIMLLSTLTMMPCSCANATTARKSLIRIMGFDGLSKWIKRVLGVMARSRASRLVVSTKLILTPLWQQSCVNNRCMPP
mmetsp:Transcript_98050/g.277298  ORF Transcript_98050/g.277298 Transcript_98050/m.277298 type:complete len:272 (-) Transcript_98050:710-1525(-)